MTEDNDMNQQEHVEELTEELAEEGLSREEELEAEVEKLKEQLLRTLAELENYRKRAEREREDMAKYAVTNFARELLTVSDNLRRALESVPGDHKESENLLDGLLKGVEITEKELLSIFSKHSIEKIDPMGEPFNHEVHQAMFEAEDENHKPGTVVQVLQPGYILHGRLLRPALVGVAKNKKSDG